MTCGSCGSSAVELTENTGGTTSGRFSERYECETCGATGSISGEASAPPADWRRSGRVFA